MANLSDSPTFEIHDDYYTPKSAWEQINHLIPKDKVIWESCMLNSHLSKSPEYLKELGNKVVHWKDMDMLDRAPSFFGEHFDMIVTNPPFSTEIKKKILTRFVELDKPFIIIMNSMNTFSKYIRKIFGDKIKDLQIITPDGKIHFDKLVDGELIKTKNCSFYCIYLAYKMELRNEDLWISN